MIGYIYKIQFDKIMYIGSTFSILSQRMAQHRRDYKKWEINPKKAISIYPYFKKYGIENFKIYEIQRVEVNDKQELRKYEQTQIENNNCINKYKATLDLTNEYGTVEYRKERYNKYKEEIKAKARDYHKKNKDKQNANRKARYELNKTFKELLAIEI